MVEPRVEHKSGLGYGTQPIEEAWFTHEPGGRSVVVAPYGGIGVPGGRMTDPLEAAGTSRDMGSDDLGDRMPEPEIGEAERWLDVENLLSHHPSSPRWIAGLLDGRRPAGAGATAMTT
jgi:hypothetical protein